MLTPLKLAALSSAELRLERHRILLPKRELIVGLGPGSPLREPETAKFNYDLLEVMAGHSASVRPKDGWIPFEGTPLESPSPEFVPSYAASFDAPRAAKVALGRKLSSIEKVAVETAHLVGLGDLGKDQRHFACFGNFTKQHIVEKARILHGAGFTDSEIHVLIRTGIVGSSGADSAHYAICADLFNGRVVDAHPYHANDNTKEVYWVRLYNDATGRFREALFKPRQWGDCDGWGRNTMEYVAYELNRMLQMDLVPPVAYRRHIEVDFKHFDEGAMLYLVPDAHLLHRVPEPEWGHTKELFLSDARILDILLQNPDRHKANYLRGKHWVDGAYRPMLIDHAAALRPGTYVDLYGVEKVRRRTFEALKWLHYDWLRERLGEFLSHEEICFILHLRNEILAYFERLIRERKWENVVVG